MTLWIPAADVQNWLGADKITLDAAAALAQVASDAVQGIVQRDLTLQTVTDTLDTNGTDYVLLHYWPVRSIGSVLLNGQTLQPAAYQISGWRMDSINQRKLIFSGMGKQARGVMNVTVSSLVAGYDTTVAPGTAADAPPGDLYQALRLTAAAIFNSQAADPNLVSEETAGVFSGSFQPAGVGSVPPGARTLLRNYTPENP